MKSNIRKSLYDVRGLFVIKVLNNFLVVLFLRPTRKIDVFTVVTLYLLF